MVMYTGRVGITTDSFLSPAGAGAQMQDWYVYIVECADSTLYTGIARDVGRRIGEHNNAVAAAKYTRSRRPVSLVYHEICESRSQACKREHAIKRLSRAQKQRLISIGRSGDD